MRRRGAGPGRRCGRGEFSRGRGRGGGRGGSGAYLLARGLWVSAEVVVTLGVVLLLLVVHQLWWTNREARADAGRTVQSLQREWGEPGPELAPAPAPDPGGGEGALDAEPRPSASGRGTEAAPAPAARPRTGPRWDQAYAVLRIPRIGLTAPVAEGTSKGGVLDRGYVGHYARTAQAGQAGNFALAGHRNTHGEPFRRIDRLRSGDRITVETRDAVYTYTVGKRLARTAPSDSGVIAPVPRSNITTSVGYSEPGHYLTLTTCTPEFSSRYRLVVWGKLTAMRPR
ncbi:class E sortase [Streptomyces griseus]|nr:class E sortase [Streptomyces fimicarius]